MMLEGCIRSRRSIRRYQPRCFVVVRRGDTKTHLAARYRVRHMDVRFPIESEVAKSLGLFARQD